MKVLFYYRGADALGISCMAALLKERGHECELIFDPGLDNNQYFALSSLRRFNRIDRMAAKAREYKPDLIAYSVLTNLFPSVREMATLLRHALPDVPQLAGGIHPTALPEHVLGVPEIDYVCVGEGDEAIVDLCDRLAAGASAEDIPNIWTKRPGGEIVRNEPRPLIQDLDVLPYPDKDLFYKYGVFKDFVYVMTGRGCPYKCSFCEEHMLARLYSKKGKYARRYSPRRAVDELKHYTTKYPVRKFRIVDGTFTYHKKWLLEWAELYAAELRLPYYAFVEPNTLDDEVVEALRVSGCEDAYVGIDTGDKTIREDILKRKTDYEKMEAELTRLKKAGIRLTVSTMVGIPGETDEHMWKTVDLVDRIKPDIVGSFIMYPFPSTDIFFMAQERGMIDERAIEKVRRGEGGMHYDSLFAHPYAGVAERISKFLPLYNKMPGPLKPLMKYVMKSAGKQLAHFIFCLMIPIIYPGIAAYYLKDMYRMARAAARN